MNININRVLISVTVPTENAESLRQSICDAGAGIIGDYTHCTSNTITKGTFIPIEDANPYIGEKNKLKIVEEPVSYTQLKRIGRRIKHKLK